MSNEARIQTSLSIKSGSFSVQSNPTVFTADVTNLKGPSPGAITISVHGTIIDFSQLTLPGLCTLQNLDPTNYVEYGIREPLTNLFYPMGEILPGEIYVLRLSRNLNREYVGTGTGTGGTIVGDSVFYMRANSAQCNVVVGGFDA